MPPQVLFAAFSTQDITSSNFTSFVLNFSSPFATAPASSPTSAATSSFFALFSQQFMLKPRSDSDCVISSAALARND